MKTLKYNMKNAWKKFIINVIVIDQETASIVLKYNTAANIANTVSKEDNIPDSIIYFVAFEDWKIAPEVDIKI